MALLTIAIVIIVGAYLSTVLLALDAANETINQERHRQIMAKVSGLGLLLAPIAGGLTDLGTTLGALGPQLDKGLKEILKALTDNDPELPQDIVDKLTAMGQTVAGLNTAATASKQLAQQIDDLNADAPAAGGEGAPAEGSPS